MWHILHHMYALGQLALAKKVNNVPSRWWQFLCHFMIYSVSVFLSLSITQPLMVIIQRKVSKQFCSNQQIYALYRAYIVTNLQAKCKSKTLRGKRVQKGIKRLLATV